MSDKLALRSAQPQDFAYCRRVYFECMKWIIQTLNLDLAQHREGFARQWQLAEVRIITVAGEDVGLVADCGGRRCHLSRAAIFGRPLPTARDRQPVMYVLIEDATHAKKAITLAVVKINPARRLYDRLGFRVTHEDQHKVYMWREPDQMPT
jgi:hypothetical protein